MRPIPSVLYVSSQGMQSSFIFFARKAKVSPAIMKDKIIYTTSFIQAPLLPDTIILFVRPVKEESKILRSLRSAEQETLDKIATLSAPHGLEQAARTIDSAALKGPVAKT